MPRQKQPSNLTGVHVPDASSIRRKTEDVSLAMKETGLSATKARHSQETIEANNHLSR
jgi:hypothetical protein